MLVTLYPDYIREGSKTSGYTDISKRDPRVWWICKTTKVTHLQSLIADLRSIYGWHQHCVCIWGGDTVGFWCCVNQSEVCSAWQSMCRVFFPWVPPIGTRNRLGGLTHTPLYPWLFKEGRSRRAAAPWQSFPGTGGGYPWHLCASPNFSHAVFKYSTEQKLYYFLSWVTVD